MRFFDLLLAGPRWIHRVWTGSLLVRITTTTLVLSMLAMGVLGFSLLSRVTTGLLNAKESVSVAEASAGLADAQRLLDAASTGAAAPTPARLVDTVVTALASRAGAPGNYEVLLLSSSPGVSAPERGTNLVSVASVPLDLRVAVTQTQRESWTYTSIDYLDGRAEPGLVVGAPITISGVGPYELYYLFPLDQEQQTLDLVRSAVLGTGLLLVGLLVFVAWLVTRQVVNPVRAAAATARRFSEGNFSERMRVKGADDLAQLAASFNEMAASIGEQISQLENLSRVQQRFVSDVSHELRTPLTTIRMASDLMFEERSAFDPPTARAAELLQTQIDRFELLLSDLLEISRFDAGAAQLELDSVDFRGVVRRVVEASIPLADKLGTSVRMFGGTHDYRIEADARRIERILRNLLDNAIEHSDRKGVDVVIDVNENAVAVTVRDYGVGLRPGEAALVFNRFWRADPARARTTGGTGLGLSIAFEDARLHRGWLEAWGEPGQGACFRLTLPRSRRFSITESPLPLDPEETEVHLSEDSSKTRLVGRDTDPSERGYIIDSARTP
jgi:two-component system sensor histidine kinase MtrB